MVERITEVPRLPVRRADGHKGDFGTVLVIGGSRGMPGAAGLAANAALRSGAGLVRVATAEGVQQTVAALAPCATSVGLAEDGAGLIDRRAVGEVLAAARAADVVALGPGLGRSNGLQALVEAVVRWGKEDGGGGRGGRCGGRLVIDADGLNNLAALGRGVLPLPAGTVLTPHPGEMRRLWSAWEREALPQERVEQAVRLAQRCGAVVVLKGAGTVVTDGERAYVNQTGNAGMATGGAGDVLTGCIAALLGQGMEVLAAGILGVYGHGKAGDLAAERQGPVGMIASDIVGALPAAWQSK